MCAGSRKVRPVLAFLGVSPGETAVVAIAILLLFGAKRMPAIARSLGRAIGQFRRAAGDLSAEIMRERAPEQPAAPAKKDAAEDAAGPADDPYHADKAPSDRAG